MKKNTYKRLLAVALTAAMTISTAAPVVAAETDNTVTMEAFGSAVPRLEAAAYSTGIYTVNGQQVYYLNGKRMNTTGVIKVGNYWYNLVNGVVTPNTVAKNSTGWWKIGVNGRVDFSFNGLASNTSGTWYCQKGKVNFSANGVLKDAATGKWGYIKGGKLQVGTETVQKNSAGWWYIGTDGYVDFTKNTVAKNATGWWAIRSGKVNFNWNGFASNNSGTWYCQKGKVNFSANGVLKDYMTGRWGYVKGGKLQVGTETVQKNSAGWWYITPSGYVDFSFTGVAANDKGTWYCEGGKVQFGYTGSVEYRGHTYDIVNGKSKQDLIRTYDIVFDTDGGSEVSSQIVDEGNLVTRPDNPTKDDYVFVNWYADANYETVFEFSEQVTGNRTIYARWMEADTDGVISQDDLNKMEANELTDVIYTEDGDLSTVDGRFTEEKITSVEDAGEVLESASELFGDDFSADSEDIQEQSNDVSDEESQYYYRYSPDVDGIPVLGSQIIISTDGEGNATGLFSSYDNDINSVDTTSEITEDEAVQAALDALVQTENIDSFLESLITEDTDKDTLTAAYEDMLETTVSQIIYACDSDTEPALTYAVQISMADEEETEEEELPEVSEEIEGITEVESGDEEDEEEIDNVVPETDVVYYIYANGTEAGQVCSYIEQTEGSDSKSTVCASKDLLGKLRTYTVNKIGSTYYFWDYARKIATYKAGTKMSLFGVYVVNTLPGTLYNFKEWASEEAVSLHANLESVYDYYLNVLHRRSYDGQGAKIVATYHYRDGGFLSSDRVFGQAYWKYEKKQFVFYHSVNRDVQACLDVVAHEYTHAVIDYTVLGKADTMTCAAAPGLIYKCESGALDESYADIMGNIIEGKARDDSGRWLIQEDSSTVRDMADPSKFDQPTTYKEYKGTIKDNGGVHTNSGIFNRASYLMMTDSRTSNITDEKWAKVFYGSLFNLTQDASFVLARGAVLASAKNLGFTESQLQAIRDAFDEVGIVEPERESPDVVPDVIPDVMPEDKEPSDDTPDMVDNPRIVEDNAMVSGKAVTYDCIYFGSYPQTEVVDTESRCGTYDQEYGKSTDYVVDAGLYKQLVKASYDSKGDTVINGTRYKRIQSSDSDLDYYNWDSTSAYHYFRYDPIKWRVLNKDGNTALLLADVVLDARPYSDYPENPDSITWETSTLRSWLNGYGASSNESGTDFSGSNFIDKAFSASEQKAIYTTELVNNETLPSNIYLYGWADGGNNTHDKIFLLSYLETKYSDTAKSYGFYRASNDVDEALMAYPSTYAMAMGVDGYKGMCEWWLRNGSRGGFYSHFYITWNGNFSDFDYMDRDNGIRPALKINLSSPVWYYADTVCSDSMKGMPE